MFMGQDCRRRFIALAVMVCAVASLARAQAQPDSSFRPGFHPTYTTNYRVIKTKQQWGQSLSLFQKYGGATLQTNLGSDISEDEAQNALQQRAARSSNHLRYEILSGWNLGVLANFDRSRRKSTTSDLQGRNNDFRLTSRYERGLFGDNARTHIEGQAGLRESFSQSDFSSISSARRDETRQTGPSMSLDWGLTADPASNLNLQMSFTTESFSQETDQKQSDFTPGFGSMLSESDSTIKATNVDRQVTSNLKWDPKRWLNLGLSFSRATSLQLRPAPRQGELEELESDADHATFRMRLVPLSDLELTAEFDTQLDQRRSNLTAASNRDLTQDRYRLRGSYSFWGGTSLSAQLRSDAKDEDYIPIPGEIERVDLKSEQTELSGSIKRTIGSRLTAELTGQAALTSKFYADSLLDSDRLDQIARLNVSYEAWSGLTTRLSVSTTVKRTINTDPSKAANTRREVEQKILAGYTYRISSTVGVKQEVIVMAQSRVYDFDDVDKSDLTRTSRLTTDVTTKMTPTIKINLGHKYNFRNSGQYSRNDLGLRLYNLEREYIEQELRLESLYEPAAWFRLSAEQSLRTVLNRSPGAEGTRKKQYDLQLTSAVQKKLLDLVDAQLRATRILSTREDFYWRVDMTATRAF